MNTKRKIIHSSIRLLGPYGQSHSPQSLRTHAAFYSFFTTEDHRPQRAKNTSLRSSLGALLATKFCVSTYLVG